MAAKQSGLEMTVKNSTMRILIRDLRLDMQIGVYRHEEGRTQPVLVNIEAQVRLPDDLHSDRLEDWVDYEAAVRKIQALAADGHIRLVETFASLIADCLMEDDRILDLIIRLEKTAALPETRSVGIELRRSSLGR